METIRNEKMGNWPVVPGPLDIFNPLGAQSSWFLHAE